MTTTTDEATPPPPPAAVREKGYAYGGDTRGGLFEDLSSETTPELMFPESIKTYERMRKDAQIASVLRAVTAPIQRTQTWVDPNGARDEVVEDVARNFGLPIKGTDPSEDFRSGIRGRDRFSWSQHVKDGMLMLPFGHSYCEQVYREVAPNRYRIRKLAHRPSSTIAQVHVARDGGLVSIEQHPPMGAAAGMSMFGGLGGVNIPVNRLVGYVLDREGGNWLGTSILRSCYANWIYKQHALRKWAIAIDRQSSGLPVYTAPQGAKEADIAKGQQIAADARAGDNSGASLPYGGKLELLGIEGGLLDVGQFIRYQDEQIARAVLAHFLNLGSQGGGQVGSYALGSTFHNFFTLALQAVAQDFFETAQAHVVEDLVDINFGRDEPAPQLVFDEIGSTGQVDDELTLLRRAAGLEDDDALAKFLRSNVSQEAA